MMNLPAFPDQNRPDRGVLSLSGENVLGFLNNLVTCEVANLNVGEARYGALLSPQGKILHDMFIFHSETRVLIDCAASQIADLVKRLTLYRLRAKIGIEIDNTLEVGVHLTQPDDVIAYADPRRADLGFRSISDAGSFINVPGQPNYDLRRIMLGLADSDGDIGSEKIFPHEANFDQMGAVNFSKGCYVGQEVVSRMQHRGTARSRFLPIRTGPQHPRDEQITSDGVKIGEAYSHARDMAMALLRLDRLAEAKAPLMAGPAPVKVEKPDWLGYDVTLPEVAL
jgi:tRNA-modifying protein YgfZ